MTDECICQAECPARCRPDRTCDHPGCACYDLWAIETDALIAATAHLSNEEIHRMAVEAWRDQ